VGLAGKRPDGASRRWTPMIMVNQPSHAISAVAPAASMIRELIGLSLSGCSANWNNIKPTMNGLKICRSSNGLATQKKAYF
jgi:hypothetical protein